MSLAGKVECQKSDCLTNIILSQKEIKELVKKAQSGDIKAQNILVLYNARLVTYLAKREIKRSKNIDFNDLIEEGNIGLIIAIKRFDTSRDTKLNTYAGYWIRWYMEKYIQEQQSIIYVPYSAIQLYYRIKRVQNSFNDTYGRDPTIHELSEIMNYSEQQIKTALNAKRRTKSLDQPANGNRYEQKKKYMFEEVLADNKNPIRQFQENYETQEEMEELLNMLTENERYIIVHYYGIGCEKETLTKITDDLHLSRTCIRITKDKALSKICSMFYKAGILSNKMLDKLNKKYK